MKNSTFSDSLAEALMNALRDAAGQAAEGTCGCFNCHLGRKSEQVMPETTVGELYNIDRTRAFMRGANAVIQAAANTPLDQLDLAIEVAKKEGYKAEVAGLTMLRLFRESA